MLKIDYQLDPIAAAKTSDVDLASADSESLRYRFFLGDIYLRNQGADFSAPWGWVSVLDFALSLKAIADTLSQGGTEHFEFTESDAALNFRRTGTDVEISSTYAPGVLRVSFPEFREQAHRFARKVLRDLCMRNLRLAANPEIRRYLDSTTE